MHHASYAVGAASLSRKSLARKPKLWRSHIRLFVIRIMIAYHIIECPHQYHLQTHNIGIYYVLLEGQASATHMRSLRKPIQKSSRGLEWRDGQLLPYLTRQRSAKVVQQRLQHSAVQPGLDGLSLDLPNALPLASSHDALRRRIIRAYVGAVRSWTSHGARLAWTGPCGVRATLSVPSPGFPLRGPRGCSPTQQATSREGGIPSQNGVVSFVHSKLIPGRWGPTTLRLRARRTFKPCPISRSSLTPPHIELSERRLPMFMGSNTP